MGSRSRSASRDQAVDVIRGLCIVSMVLSHTARDSPLDTYLHLDLVDGASGFFLMSGLVLGMVQRRVVDRDGLRAGEVRFARRLGLLYVAQLVLVAAAIAVAPLRVNEFRVWPSVGEYSGWPSFVLHVLALQVNPKDLDVLPVYIVVFALAAVVLPLLLRFGVRPVAVGLGVLYAAATVVPSATTLPRGFMDGPSAFNWGTWQLLFFSGFLVGWCWRERGIGELLLQRRVVLAAGSGAVVVYAGAYLVSTFGAPGELVFEQLFEDKRNNAPGRLVLAWLVFVVLYGLVTWLIQQGRLVLVRTEAATLGRGSLSAYVILCLSVSVSALLPGYEGPNGVAMALALAVCIVALVWAHLREAVAGTRVEPLPLAGSLQTDAQPVDHALGQ
jgi:hypothetical protein